MSESSSHPPRPHCPALLICQQARTTPQRLADLLGVMNAIGITQLPADVTFTVHFALTEGEGLYRLALFLEQGAGATPGDRFQLWSGDVSLRHRAVVHEQSVPVTARFSAPGQCQLALYANGEGVGHRPLSIGKVG
jgi:hypothetical protein